MIEWIMEKFIPIFGFAAFAFLILAFFVGVPILIMADVKCRSALLESGFSSGDISAFTKVTEFSTCDILNSSGTMAQFNKFLNGESIDTNFQLKKRQTKVVPIIIR